MFFSLLSFLRRNYFLNSFFVLKNADWSTFIVLKPKFFIICDYYYHLLFLVQSSTQRTKLTTFVKCPYSGLDLHPYVAPRNNSMQSSHNSLALWSPWKRSRSHPYAKSEEYVYDLCAVCNHHGNIHGGHYTGKVSVMFIHWNIIKCKK